MNALVYFNLMRTKNRFLQFVRSPGKVIYAALVVFVVVMSFASRNLPSDFGRRDIGEFYVILLGIYTFVFVTVSKTGFSDSSQLFSMADVNLMFTSPLKNTNILINAVMQQLGRSLIPGVLLLMQFNNIHNFYAVNYGTFLLAVLFYCLTVFFSHMLSVMIYTFCSAGERIAAAVKAIYYSALTFFGACAVIGSFDREISSFSVEGAVSCLNKGLFKLIPVSGYFTSVFQGITEKDTPSVIFGVVMLMLLVISFLLVVRMQRLDFYENVVCGAELLSDISTVQDYYDRASSGKKIRTGKTGLRKGFGASAIYEKNKLENRRSGVLYIDASTVIFALIGGVCAFVLDSVWTIFIVMVYFLMFSLSSGRYLKELKKPYVYLIPEKSSKKLFNLIKEQLPVYFVQSAFIFLPLHFILRLDIIETVSMVVGRFSFCMLFTGVTMLMLNLFSTTKKGMLYGLCYLVFSFVFSLASVLCAFAVSGIFVFDFEFTFFSLSIINIAVSFILIALNRNLLDKGMQ